MKADNTEIHNFIRISSRLRLLAEYMKFHGFRPFSYNAL